MVENICRYLCYTVMTKNNGCQVKTHLVSNIFMTGLGKFLYQADVFSDIIVPYILNYNVLNLHQSN